MNKKDYLIAALMIIGGLIGFSAEGFGGILIGSLAGLFIGAILTGQKIPSSK